MKYGKKLDVFSFFLQIYMSACVWNELRRLSPSLKKRLMSGYNLDKVAAIQWGYYTRVNSTRRVSQDGCSGGPDR